MEIIRNHDRYLDPPEERDPYHLGVECPKCGNYVEIEELDTYGFCVDCAEKNHDLSEEAENE